MTLFHPLYYRAESWIAPNSTQKTLKSDYQYIELIKSACNVICENLAFIYKYFYSNCKIVIR